MTDKHTPGSIALDRMLALSTDSQVTAPCGCELFRSGPDSKSVTFRYCDTHAAAPELLKALESWTQCDFCSRCRAFAKRRHAAIKAVKGD